MENVVLTIHLILALLLIGAVLLQRSEGGGLGIGGGGGTASARGAATAMTKVTWIFAAAFIVTSITLTILATRVSDGGSVVDRAASTEETAIETPATEAPADGGGLAGTGLTLPGSADAPATPPRADEPAAPATNP